MDKKELQNKTYLILGVAAFYFIGILKGNDLWGNISSPATAFTAGYLIWSGARRLEKYRFNWKLIMYFAIFWGFTDTLWFICSDLLGLDPENMSVFMYLYLVPNILLTIATVMYFFKNMRRWHTAQVALDSTTTLVILFVFFWHTTLKDYQFNYINYEDVFSIFLYLLTDIFVMSIVIVMYMQRDPGKLERSRQLLISAIVVYTVSDLYYTYLLFKDAYDANTLIDFAYMSAIILFALACIHEVYEPSAAMEDQRPEAKKKSGRLYQYVLLGTVPLVFYFTGYFTGVIIFLVAMVLVIYMLLSNFIQENIRGEYLLKREKQLNERLEDTISERTRDLIEANRMLDRLTKIDILTGLYNRRYLLEAMDKTISEECSSFSTFYMDLDRFKTINDTHGHDMGDKILVTIAERLNSWRESKEQPENIVISRLGGDEFSIILKGDNSLDRLEKLCLELARLINEPLIIKQYIFNLGVSIGVSRFPDDSRDREQLVRYADMAMYQAKKGYGNLRYIIFDKGTGQLLQKTNELEMLLKNADFEEEFELHYQPQFCIKSGHLVGVEALLRWNSPSRGRISPMEFIPIAEETGLILEIGNWVMKKAIQQIRYWNETYKMDLVAGINISARQIDSVNFLPDFKRTLACGGIDPKWLDLEITETSAMNTNVIMEEILTELSGMGFSISIDDFGTGYSSLSYIKRFDIDRLKIAKELIDNISFDKDDLHIVKAIVMMARGLGLRTIAEGVETNEQLNILRMIGCDEVQGYLLSRPLPAKVFEENFLENEAAALN